MKSTDWTPKLGEIIIGDAKRDAIHIAVAPVIAGQRLQPGDHVSLTKDQYKHATLLNPDDSVGIVDPFLKGAVLEGEMFWLFLYPNTVTSLRHVWTHPAFNSGLTTVGQ